MSDIKWVALILVNLLPSLSVAAEEANEPPLLDQTPTSAAVAVTEKMIIFSYTYTSLDNFRFKPSDTSGEGDSDELEFSGGGLHTIGISWKREDEAGGLLSFGFSDELRAETVGTLYDGYGSVDADLRRYEFDLAAFRPLGGHTHGVLGLKYLQTAVDFDFQRLSGNLLSQSFRVTNQYLGLLLGVGGNHPLSKGHSLLSLYWSAQVLGLMGWTDKDDLQYVDSYYYYDYGWEEESTAFLAVGLNGTIGLQMHLGDHFTVGGGYKAQYLYGEQAEESFNGWMALAMIRI